MELWLFGSNLKTEQLEPQLVNLRRKMLKISIAHRTVIKVCEKCKKYCNFVFFVFVFFLAIRLLIAKNDNKCYSLLHSD